MVNIPYMEHMGNNNNNNNHPDYPTVRHNNAISGGIQLKSRTGISRIWQKSRSSSSSSSKSSCESLVGRILMYRKKKNSIYGDILSNFKVITIDIWLVVYLPL